MTYATLCACRKLNKMPGHNVLCGAARRDVQGRFNAASEFSPFVPNFSLVPVCSGKKTVLREKFGCRCRTAGLERAGMAGRDGAGAGMGGRAGRDGAGAGPGWGPGPGWGGVGDVRVPT